MKLLGKVALVTGGSQGIGRGVALRLARDGADVVVAYRSHPEEAKETSVEIEAYGRRVVAFKAERPAGRVMAVGNPAVRTPPLPALWPIWRVLIGGTRGSSKYGSLPLNHLRSIRVHQCPGEIGK